MKARIMKRMMFVMLLSMAALLQGCIVKSLHPFYTVNDLVFRQELVNSWIDDDGNKWLIRRSEDTPAYEMRWLGQGDRNLVFLAHLFQLEGELYFDFIPIEDEGKQSYGLFDLHLVAVHSVAKVHRLSENEIQIKWFNEKWLKSLFEQNRIKISHEVIKEEFAAYSEDPDEAAKEIREYVLTGSTEELQKFLIKYGNDDAAFADKNTVWLKLQSNP